MPCIFCDFVSGERKKNVNGLPFIPIHKTKHSLSFLSIDSPVHEKSHLLVIPKKHFKNFDEIPEIVRNDLMKHLALAGKVLRKKHSGYNILLNSGKAAGQYVNHAHFHIVPRDKSDGIKIEVWKAKKLSEKKFVEISERLRKSFEEIGRINLLKMMKNNK